MNQEKEEEDSSLESPMQNKFRRVTANFSRSVETSFPH
jgi:hypothetical protein